MDGCDRLAHPDSPSCSIIERPDAYAWGRAIAVPGLAILDALFILRNDPPMEYPLLSMSQGAPITMGTWALDRRGAHHLGWC